MSPSKLKNSPNASTSDVNINMECEDEENMYRNMMANIYRNEPKPPRINIISSDGTSRSISKDDEIPQELSRPTPRPRQKMPAASTSRHGSYNVTPEPINIELPSIHSRSSSNIEPKVIDINRPTQQFTLLPGPATSEASNEKNNLSVRDNVSCASEYWTPTGPGSFFLTPNVRTALGRSLNSQVSSAAPSYRTALNVTPHSGYMPEGRERSPSNIINSICSRVRHPFGRHARLEIMSPTTSSSSATSSPSRSFHLKPSFPDHCLLGTSLIITGALIFILSVICLALIDNTVPDHENGIHYPIYEALYALKGQSRPINSFQHIIIEDANVGVIPVHPNGIQDYSETHLITEHGPYTMFDNDISTNWNPVYKEQSSHFYYPSHYTITVDLKNNYTMTALRIKDFGNYENDVTDFCLEVKRDGVWRLVLRYPTLPPGHKLKEINGFAVWGSLWKFSVLGTASGKQPLIKELQFFGFKGCKMEHHDHSHIITDYRSSEWYAHCLSNITDAHGDVLWGPMWIAYQVVVPILIVLGVIGNVLCIVVLSKPHVRALHVNRYFLFMTVMDLLSCLFYIPVALTISGCVFCSRTLAYYYAYLGWAIPEILQIISFCVIVFLSYDRCLAIYLPGHFRENQNHRVFRKRIIFIIAFSIILHIPIIVLGKVEIKGGTYVVRDGYRSEFDSPLYKSLFKIYSAFKEVLDYVVPSVVQMVFHIALVIAMVKMKFMHEDEQFERKKFVLNVTIITMGFFYLVTSMPVCIYNFFFAEPNDDCCHGDKDVEVFRGIANILKLSQNVLNIVFIVILNQTFKKEFFMLLPSSCCLSEDESPILHEESGQTPKKYTTDNFGFKRDSGTFSPSPSSHFEDPPGRPSYLHNSYLSSLKEVPENTQGYQQSR